MNSSKTIVLLSALLALATWPVANSHAAAGSSSGAAQSSGNITGRIKNVVTGQYLNRVRVTVKDTNNIAFTDEFGIYRLVGVPSGPVVLQVFYTDLDPQEISLNVSPGGSVERDVELTNVARYGQNAAVVKLDPFLVATNKETDADAIAINEQRFAPNIKNVIATDSLGDIVGASAGDFLKYLPGLSAEYDNAEIQGISIRGIGAGLTTVELDGAPSISTGHAGATRAVNLIPQSINNLSRIEVTKVPTPSSPADALAGSVNMISKTAFERSGAEVRYGVNLTGNFNELTLKRTPHPYRDDNTHKIVPGFDFDYTQPIGKNFGIVVTAMLSQTFNSQNISRRTWNAGGTSTGASFSNPYFQSLTIQSSPRERKRAFYGFKADWRVTPNSVLTFGGRINRTTSARTGSVVLTPNVGTIGTPTPATGTPMTFGPDFTNGATGRGSVALSGSRQLGLINGDVMDMNYRFDNGRWKFGATANYASSESLLNPGEKGPFTGVSATTAVPVRVTFSDIGPIRPATIQLFNNTNQEVDMFDINSYRMTTATRNIRRNVAISRFGKVDLGRRLEWFSFPATVQVGVLHQTKEHDRREQTETWNFVGTNHNPTPYLNQVYVNQEAHMGFRNIPGPSTVRAWDAFQADPSILTQTTAQLVATENTRLNASEFAAEEVNSYYVQGEARLLNNRLNVLAGVRMERTLNMGEGTLFDPNAVFVRNADGTFARNALGARIRKVEAGAAGSVQEALLIRTERAYTAERSYHGYYPSLHLTYDINESFLARFAYARTYGRPNYPDIIPTATINEADLEGDELEDPDIVKGSITVRNTGLKPWTADNYDLSAEYYTPQGGMFSAGVFLKEITDFFGTSVRIATLADLEEVGLDPRYLGWNLNTKFNSGDARISGVEFNARYPLRQIGEWGRYFTVFANATKLRLEGNPHASFTSFIPETANWGFSFNWKRLTVVPKWNYRGLNKLVAQPAFGPDGFQYIKARLILDLSVAYRLSKQLSLSASVGNVTNDNLTQMHYSSETPGYARRSLNGEYGVAFSIGIKGTY